MSRNGQVHRRTLVGAEILAGTAIAQHQLMAVLEPQVPTGEIITRSGGGAAAAEAEHTEIASLIKKRLGTVLHVRIG
jgi:hypothetical protein